MSRLQIDNIAYSAFAKNMVVALHPITKSKVRHEVAKVIETDIRIRCATQNLLSDCIEFAHTTGSGQAYSYRIASKRSTAMFLRNFAEL
jgi:hypothetical protein